MGVRSCPWLWPPPLAAAGTDTEDSMTEISALVEWVDRLRNVTVLCVGDAMLDRFVYGSVNRISPEAPIPVLRIQREQAMLGGAGNVVRNLVALGSKSSFVALIGEDAAGREVEGLLSGIDASLVRDMDRQTTIKTRYIASSQQLLRTDSETESPVSQACQQQILDAARPYLSQVGAVVLSDYGKGVLTPMVIAELIAAANQLGVPVVVDPKGNDYRRYAGADVLTPNRKELIEATGMKADNDDQVIAAARHLITTCNVKSVLVTRSQDGMSLVTADQVAHLPAQAQEVFDVSGAGDTVIATFAAAIAAGAKPLDAARIANVAAGIVVAKVGTAVAYAEEVIAALHHGELQTAEHKVLGRDVAAGVIERWRSKGLKVGFTNGCFDLLHPGHIALLNQARSACDKLVVGLNSDASVQRLKGPTRPVQSEAARATVLASLSVVDLVVIFGEDTPLDLICGLKPSVLVKGADYTIDTVVGAKEVASWGGEVFLAQLVPGQSTTSTIARINAG